MKWYCNVNKLSLSNKYFMQTKQKKWSAMRCKLGITMGNCAPHLPCSSYPTVIRGSFYLLRRCCSLQYNMIECKLQYTKTEKTWVVLLQKQQSLCSQQIQICIQALPLFICVTMAKLFNIFEPPHPHVQFKGKNTYFVRLL